MNKPTISICIPAYKRTSYLKRLLDSIAIQTFKDFEVIVTDDSPTTEVHTLCSKYQHLFSLTYKKNPTALGTPANWNEAISIAKGEWIKLMHDDDWFSNERSLEVLAEGTTKGNKFIFCAYTNVYESAQEKKDVHFPKNREKKLLKNPLLLMVENIIGPPSVTLVHHSIKETYDILMKWRVDIDFYIRVLNNEQTFTYINQPLINVGISDEQVTNSCLNVPEVELPEGLLLLLKYGTEPLKNIWVYDAWWRVIRNTGIRSVHQLYQYTPYLQWPVIINRIVMHQSKISPAALQIGVLSKTFMFLSYLKNIVFAKIT